MIQENISLRGLNTMKTGGVARYFADVHSVDELITALIFSKEKSLPIYVLGEGSNLLVSDAGFSGLVIKMSIKGIVWNHDGFVVVGAGENWDSFVFQSVEKGFYGLENLSGIPGTVGASPVQNIGAYGVEVGNTIEWVEALDIVTMKTVKLSKADCQFKYRDSIFKHESGKKLIITKVCFSLKQNGELNTKYADVQKYLIDRKIDTPNLGDVRSAVLEIRAGKLPKLSDFGTAGSFFKNPIIPKQKYDELKNNYPDLPFYDVGSGLVKVPLAWILDKVCNLKGFRKGNVGIYKDQPLVLVNFGEGTTSEIDELADHIVEQVKEKTGIIIEREVGRLQ